MENAQFYTYLHCRPDGSPFYVGKGCGKRSHNFTKRSAHHKNIVAKYGRENIGVFTFHCESEEQAHTDEIQQIAQLRRDGYELCNHTDGGEGSSGCMPSKETRARISVAGQGRKHSPETRAKISAARKGKPCSAAARANLSVVNKGKKLSPETRAKISAAGQGRKLSESHRAKLLSVHKGRECSPETRAKISVAVKARNARNK